MLGNEADALDATQDTLVAALRALGRFDGRSSFGTWIYRIATNTCIDEMRRRRRRPVTGIAADIAEVADEVSFGAPGLFILPTGRGADPSEAHAEEEYVGHGTGRAVDAGATRSARTDRSGTSSTGPSASGLGPDPADIVAARVDIDAALGALPVEFRTAIVLRDVCDLPYDEIAQILDVPVGTVRSRIARARSTLAATWTTDMTERDVPPGGVARRVTGNSSDLPVVRSAENDREDERGSDHDPTEAQLSSEHDDRHRSSVSERPQKEERTQ